VVARANHHIRYPARVQLVAAMNPCRCGYGGVGKGACGKAPKCQRDYQGRVSGPMMDRIDLQIDVPPVTAADMALPPPAEGSAEVAARVQAARHIQTERARRLGLPPEAAVNATASGSALEAIAPLDEAARTLLVQAAQRANLSARAWTRCVRLARTIADIESALSGEETPILRRHVAEALIYRRAASEPQPTAVLSGKIPTA
jgi:magnesium chelatase family protein